MSIKETVETEGVVKFSLDHEPHSLRNVLTNDLDNWRSIFKQLEILGQIEGRYDGYGFGNLSQRTVAGFVISGTQTGHLSKTSLTDYAEVLSWHVEQNQLSSIGLVKPSSESLTHGVIYAAQPRVNYVYHVHSPDIWHAAKALNIATTDPQCAYGTPEIAHAVQSIAESSALPNVLAMGGHEDGIIAFGEGAKETGLLLVEYLSEAKSISSSNN